MLDRRQCVLALGGIATGSAIVATLPEETSAEVSNELQVPDVDKTLGPNESVTSATLTVMGDASYTADVVPDEYVVTLTVDETELDTISNSLNSSSKGVGYELQGDLLETDLTTGQLTPDGEETIVTVDISVMFELLYNGSTMASDTISTTAQINLSKETVTADISNSANGSISVSVN